MSYDLYVYDTNFNIVKIVDDYEYLRWNIRYRTVDSFELKINRYKTTADYLQLGYIIQLRKGVNFVREGIIESKEIELSGEGKLSEAWDITGRGLDGILAERLALYGTDSGNGYDSQSGIAETLMRHYVDVNCISSSDTDRNYSFLELEPDQERGASVKYDARFQSIAEILEDLSLASGLGWTVTFDSSNKKFKFRVLQGLDRSWGNGVNSVVVFSPEFGNIKLIGYKKTRIDSKTVAYVGGQGEAELRTVQKVTKDGLTYTNLDRREFFVDARDLDTTDKLTQRGNEKLVELGEEEVIEFENLPTGPFEFETDFNVGDIITVKYPGIFEADTRIIEVTEEITPEQGIQNKLVVGREYPDLIGFLKLSQKNISAEIRR